MNEVGRVLNLDADVAAHCAWWFLYGLASHYQVDERRLSDTWHGSGGHKLSERLVLNVECEKGDSWPNTCD